MVFPRVRIRTASVYTLIFSLILTAGVAGFASIAGASAGTGALTSAYMSPGGTGTSCTSAAPCGSLSAALAASADGATITVAGGDYGDQTVKALTRTQSAKNVTVQAAAGQTPVFGKTLISQAGITFTGLTFNAALRLNLGPATVTNVHMIGAPILVRGNNITITNSLIEGGAAHDGINIAGYPDPVHDVLVQGNTVRDIGASSGKEEHPDCIQVFDANHITIEQNNLYNCWNSALTFSPGAHKGISDVLVQANFLQGCIPERQTCGNGGSNMDLRTTVTNVTIRNDTFGKGSVRLPYQPGVTATHNIVGYLSVASPCTTSLTNSLIGGYPTYDCKNGAPGTTPTTNSGNTTGTPTYTDPTNGNLHLATSPAPSNSSAAVANTSGDDATGSTGGRQDIDRQPLMTSTFGADQPGSGAPANADVVFRIAVKVSSAVTESSSLWFRAPVRVAFICTARATRLRTPCPKALTVARNGVTTITRRTITSVSGVSAATHLLRVRVDRTAPKLTIKGLHKNGRYRSKPNLRCTSTDRVSGRGTCKVYTKSRHGRVSFTAIAHDKAGNTTIRRGHLLIT